MHILHGGKKIFCNHKEGEFLVQIIFIPSPVKRPADCSVHYSFASLELSTVCVKRNTIYFSNIFIVI